METKSLSDAQHSDHPTQLRGVLDQVKLIATGGMSQVYRARQPALDRYLVIKKLKDELLRNPETAERFRREAKALASLLHQNIAHVYDFVETPREAYLLMEHIDGIDLSTVVEKVGHLPPQLCGAILLGMCKGVAYIHAHGLIHRDIKPSNIRLTTRGEVKLMDFGIVLELDKESLTRPGMMVGSPSYLSPEQVLGDSLTAQSDIFLLGICLYEMLTGIRPFREEDGETIFQRIRDAKYVPARKMQSRVPSALDRIVRRCLQRRPQARYSSVKEMVEELEVFLGSKQTSHTDELILRFLDREALVNSSVPIHDLEGDEDAGPRGWRRWLWPLLALLGIAAGFGGGFWFAGHQSSFSMSTELRTPASKTKPAPAKSRKNPGHR